MRTADGEVVAPFSTDEFRQIVADQLGITIQQSTVSRSISKGWLHCHRIGRRTVFSDADVAFNLHWLQANWNADAGQITRRRQKYVRNRNIEPQEEIELPDNPELYLWEFVKK